VRERRPLLGLRFKGKSKQELRDTGLLVEEDWEAAKGA
jgi:hypothetical protein